MSSPLQKSVQKLRGQRVRVIGNDGRTYVGWLERIGNGGHLVLRDAWDNDADERVDPAHVRAPKSVVGVEPDSKIERVDVDEISPAPYHAREFDASENRRYISQVRDDGWTGSFPVARETDDGLEVVEGHKRLWVAEQAGLETHPVRIADVDDWAAARRFVADHLPDERHVQDDGTTDGYYESGESATAIATLVERWGDRALELDRVAWNVDRLGLEVTGRDECSDEVGEETEDTDTGGDAAETEDGEDDEGEAKWCAKCGYGPSSEIGVARHDGHAHSGDASVVNQPPADDGESESKADQSESESDEGELTPDRVLEELATMVEDDGYGWVQSSDLANRLDTTGAKVGSRLRVLREGDRVEKRDENAAFAVWRPVDAPEPDREREDTEEIDENPDPVDEDDRGDDQDDESEDGDDPFIRASRKREVAESDERDRSTEADTHQTESESPSEAETNADLEESDADDEPEAAGDVVDDDDDDDDEGTAFPRECHCGATLEDSLELSVHRTEEHGVPQGHLGHLESGEFEEIVTEAETFQDIIDTTGWSPEKALRAIGVYGLSDVVGPNGTELSDVADFEFDGVGEPADEADPAIETEEDTDPTDTAASDDEPSSRSVANDGGAVAFTDYSAPSGSDSDTRCQNCGSHVDKQFTRVFEPESEGAPRACPNCEDLVREGDGTIRRKRGQGTRGGST